MPLYLIRHGQTAWNADGRAQGQRDIPLDDAGSAQARALAAGWASPVPAEVWSSDLARARRTAEVLAESWGGPVLRVDVRLRETSFGDWEGEDYAEVRRRMEALASHGTGPADVRPPGGESRREVYDRVASFAAGLDRERAVAVVGHGAALTLMLAHLLGAPPESAWGFLFGNTGVSELHPRTGGGWRLVRYNDLSHLTERTPVRAGGR